MFALLDDSGLCCVKWINLLADLPCVLLLEASVAACLCVRIGFIEVNEAVYVCLNMASNVAT